jgi:hypothetical protein
MDKFKENKMKRILSSIAMIALLGSVHANATSTRASGLVIHGVELGVGKFHRMDNGYHGYTAANEWVGYVMPKGVQPTPEMQPIQQTNADGSITIFFSNLDELMATAVQASKTTKTPISIFNIEAHGLPGGMWYPKDRAQRDSGECSSWRDAAYGPDEANYNQYYGAVAKQDIEFFRSYAQSEDPGGINPCITGLTEWQEEAQKTGFSAALADGAEIHFISCIVGLGNAGNHFTAGLAQALFSGGKAGKVLTSVNFGLGDWSIPEGMGFWDYINDDQLNRDNANYVKNRNDREIAQAGTVRISEVSSGKVNTQTFAIADKFLPISVPVGKLPPQSLRSAYDMNAPMGGSSSAMLSYAHIPHTSAWVGRH